MSGGLQDVRVFLCKFQADAWHESEKSIESFVQPGAFRRPQFITNRFSLQDTVPAATSLAVVDRGTKSEGFVSACSTTE